jgi:hypothetical protein
MSPVGSESGKTEASLIIDVGNKNMTIAVNGARP